MQDNNLKKSKVQKNLRWPGIEPGSTAWKAAMLTTIPPSHDCNETILSYDHCRS